MKLLTIKLENSMTKVLTFESLIHITTALLELLKCYLTTFHSKYIFQIIDDDSLCNSFVMNAPVSLSLSRLTPVSIPSAWAV